MTCQVNFHLYHYAGNNPVKYVDPTGMWVDNEDGTFTAEQGDTLWDLYGADWQEKSGYTGNPSELQIGETVGKLNEWNVSGEGAGTGAYVSALFGNYGAQADLSGYTMNFEIKETGEKFSESYYSLSKTGEGYKFGLGIYVIDIDASAVFKGKKPTAEQIKESFSGISENIGFSFVIGGVSGSKNELWTVTNGTLSIGSGEFFSFGIEKSVTWRR